MVDMEIPGSPPRPTAPETLGLEPDDVHFTEPSSDSDVPQFQNK